MVNIFDDENCSLGSFKDDNVVIGLIEEAYSPAGRCS